MTWAERLANYAKETGYPLAASVDANGQVYGIWVMGNNYATGTALYGGYPYGYLARIKALFPEKRRVLHLFSGDVALDVLPGDTVDVRADRRPTYVDDAQTLALVPVDEYDLICADPPYSVEDAEHYGPTMVKRNKVMDALGQRMTPGAHVAWLDQVLPMYRKVDFAVEGYVGMVKSTNHRFRVVTIFRKKEQGS